MPVLLNRSTVRKAGSMVRKFYRGECSPEELEPAIEVILAYRAGFNDPLGTVHARLLDIHDELSIHGEITRRLKKSSTIFDKLIREPGLDLSRMQDIGGCRSVVKSMEELELLRDRVAREWKSRVTDYVVAPRPSGYRAIHVIVSQDEQQIEIQLRTAQMHEWAQMVEGFSVLIGDNYKQDGDHLVQRYMRALSALMAALETGLKPDPGELAILKELRPQVETLLTTATEKTEEDSHEQH